MKTARIVIYIALTLSIGVAALAQHNGQTTISSTSRSQGDRTREPLNPEHPGLKSESSATHSRFFPEHFIFLDMSRVHGQCGGRAAPLRRSC
jgi:hypothetical protein